MKVYTFFPRSLPLTHQQRESAFAGRIGLRRRTRGKRYSEMVQRRQGIWLHQPGGWWRGLVCPPLGNQDDGLRLPQGGPSGRFRNRTGQKRPVCDQCYAQLNRRRPECKEAPRHKGGVFFCPRRDSKGSANVESRKLHGMAVGPDLRGWMLHPHILSSTWAVSNHPSPESPASSNDNDPNALRGRIVYD